MHKIKIVLMFTLAVLVFFSVPVYFVGYYNVFGNFLIKTLGININPALSGGEVMAVFNDKYFDDKGTRKYTYPEAEVFQPHKGHLDILKYIVKKPVRGKAWSDITEFWSVEVVMGSLENPLNSAAGFSFPVINIYISIDGIQGGSTEALFPGSNVSFDPAHPWHYAAVIHGWNTDGKLFNSRGEYIDRVLIDVIKRKDREDRLRFTIPTAKAPELNSLTENSITHHYVITGWYDPIEKSNFRMISVKADQAFGGGNTAQGTAPRVYDYLAPEGTDQYRILSGYDAVRKKYAVLSPVKVYTGAGLEKKERIRLLTEADENTFRNNKKKKTEVLINQLKEEMKNDNSDEQMMTQLAALYFQAGKIEQAEALLKKILQKNADSPAALAYSGSITAMKAGAAESNLAKMKILAEAITMLDKAAAIVKSDSIDSVHVLMCRASVYSSIPDIYDKTDIIINDLEKLKGILADTNLSELKTDTSILLGNAYAKKRMFKAALDQYNGALAEARGEYYSKKLKDKIAETELQYLDKIRTNL